MDGGGVGAGADRRKREWLRAYAQAAAIVPPRVEALAAGRERLEAFNATQHEFWEARDHDIQWHLLQVDESRRTWEAKCMALRRSGDDRMFAELLKSDNEDLKAFIQVLELENEELKIRMKEIEGGAGHCQNAADHEHIAGDLKAALRQLNQAHEALCSEKDKEVSALTAEKDKEISALIAEKDKEVSALIAEKDLVREQFRTLERDYADLRSYSSKQAAQVTEAKQELEQLQVASQKKDDKIRKLRARAKAVDTKRKLLPEDKRQEMSKETDGEIEKCKDRQPETSQNSKKVMSETHNKNCSEGPALRGRETEKYSSKQMLVKDGQPQTSQKRKCITFLPNDDGQKGNGGETSNQVLEPVNKKRVSGRREVEQEGNKKELADGKSQVEVVEFCIEYMKQRPISLPLSCHEGRLAGRPVLMGKRDAPEREMLDKAHLTVLHNTTELSGYVDEHLQEIRQSFLPKIVTKTVEINAHNRAFTGWLYNRLAGGSIDDIITWLAYRPSPTIMKYQAYEINGNTFYTEERDVRTACQNSSVRIDCLTAKGDKKEVFYGTIEEIWELNYVKITFTLFKCKWVAPSQVMVDQDGKTYVNLNKMAYNRDPFILASQATQIFYVKVNLHKNCHVVIDCPSACQARCAKNWKNKMCNKDCNICCDKCNCVPSGTSQATRNECPCYANLKNSKNGKAQVPLD